jgi:hypothetical protein
VFVEPAAGWASATELVSADVFTYKPPAPSKLPSDKQQEPDPSDSSTQ